MATAEDQRKFQSWQIEVSRNLGQIYTRAALGTAIGHEWDRGTTRPQYVTALHNYLVAFQAVEKQGDKTKPPAQWKRRQENKVTLQQLQKYRAALSTMLDLRNTALQNLQAFQVEQQFNLGGRPIADMLSQNRTIQTVADFQDKNAELQNLVIECDQQIARQATLAPPSTTDGVKKKRPADRKDDTAARKRNRPNGSQDGLQPVTKDPVPSPRPPQSPESQPLNGADAAASNRHQSMSVNALSDLWKTFIDQAKGVKKSSKTPNADVKRYTALKRRAVKLLQKGGRAFVPPEGSYRENDVLPYARLKATLFEEETHIVTQDWNRWIDALRLEESDAVIYWAIDEFEKVLVARREDLTHDNAPVYPRYGQVKRYFGERERRGAKPPDVGLVAKDLGFRLPALGEAELPGHWTFLETVGEGGQGHAAVWVQYDVYGKITSRVCLKETYLFDEAWSDATIWHGDLEDRCPMEAKIHGDCSSADTNSSAIVRFLAYAVHKHGERKLYRTYCEYCEHGDLESLIKNHIGINIFIPATALWSIFSRLVAALHVLRFGHIFLEREAPDQWSMLLHRDIKPANVFLTKPDDLSRAGIPKVQLGDFGHAIHENRRDVRRCGFGTAGYKAPEQINEAHMEAYGGDVGTYSDLWSVGRIMMALMNLEEAELITNAVYLGDNITPPVFTQTAKDFYPATLIQYVEACIAVDPTQRWDDLPLLIYNIDRHLNDLEDSEMLAYTPDKWVSRLARPES